MILKNNRIRLSSEEESLFVNRSEIKLKQGLYTILYLRPNSFDNSSWKVLGSSPIFELNVIKRKKEPMEKTQKFHELEKEIFQNKKKLDETFVPLGTKKINLENYYMKPKGFKSLTRKSKENKENTDPNSIFN